MPWHRSVNNLLTDGFRDFGETDPGLPTLAIASKIGRDIGAVVWKQPEPLHVSPIGSKPLNTYGGNYGLGDLPLHTDLAHWHRPPRYVLLRAIRGSTLVSTRVLHHERLRPYIPLPLMS